jgi:uncharacterized SAM-binding protein YcdF (DUF218 family)
MQNEIDQAAKVIWGYMLLHQSLQKCDAVFLLGNRDDRTGEYAAKLFLEGYGRELIISGGGERLHWDDASTEAAHFALIAERMGVPRDQMLLEERATNTGENIAFVHALLQRLNKHPHSLLLVQKPYMERRTFATFVKQWPEEGVKIVVTSPVISYDEYFDRQNPKQDIIDVMVGDLQRISEYPKLGFQIEQEIPTEVWQAWEKLVELGYTKHLIKH